MSVVLAAIAAASAIAGVHQYASVAISPDGGQVAAVESVDTPGRTQQPHGVVVVRKATDGAVLATFDPCPACRYADPAWSPAGALVFAAWDPAAKESGLWLGEGGAVRPLATFDGLIARPRYSPDGKTLAVLATERPRKESGATNPGAPRVGEIGGATDERRIAVLAGASLRLVSPADRFVYEYDWTPDGKGFVATDAIGDGDNNWWIAKLEAVDLTTGAARTIASPKTQAGFPRVSADGKTVTYIGGLMSDFPVIGGDIWTVPFTGGEPTNATPDFKGSFNSLQWRKGQLYATALVGDQQTLFLVGKDWSLKRLYAAPTSISAGDARISLSADGKSGAMSLQTFAMAPTIFAGRLDGLHPIATENASLVANGDARSIAWTSEGHAVQGWLLAPKGLQPGKTYPMVVSVHGGPSSATEPRFQWEGSIHTLLDHGYAVFMPNPRGSYGQGEAFTRANVQDFGGGDLRDILAGVDAIEKQLPIDDKRLAVMGGSYGGFMTMWAVTHTNRFRAAAAGAGISDWVSYYGQNGIDQWMTPFFGGTAYDNPAVYDRLSPIRSIKQARTPTFIYVGELDVECPPAQSLEFWHGLAAMGVPTSLVIYPGEGHHVAKPANQQDIEARTLSWFDRYLGSGQ